MNEETLAAFKQEVWSFYKSNRRSFPWRDNREPYAILVSEVMLQQTQVNRVVDKFNAWMIRFPTIESLAKAPLREVLSLWNGLGYNRRALYLKRCAEEIVVRHSGKVPTSIGELDALPGIGYATACAICVFAFNKPVSFIETNIRSVFIRFFFKDKGSVQDSELFPFIEKTLDYDKPREWYYALMDYGTMLKKQGNPNKRSAHYVRQSRFEGSDRQMRGAVIRALTKESRQRVRTLTRALCVPASRARRILNRLEKDGLIRMDNGVVSLA